MTRPVTPRLHLVGSPGASPGLSLSSRCDECGRPCRKVFCSKRCRQISTNRRMQRGAQLLDIAMRWRSVPWRERGALLTIIWRLLKKWLDEDRAVGRRHYLAPNANAQAIPEAKGMQGALRKIELRKARRQKADVTAFARSAA